MLLFLVLILCAAVAANYVSPLLGLVIALIAVFFLVGAL